MFTRSDFDRSFWRKLWSAHAISITISSNSIRVFLKMSFTMRHRLIPEITCSTTILELEMMRFKSLSPTERVPLRGFFWAGRLRHFQVHSPEIPYPSEVSSFQETHTALHHRLLCHGRCLHMFDSS